jgi:hypothetical protein
MFFTPEILVIRRTTELRTLTNAGVGIARSVWRVGYGQDDRGAGFSFQKGQNISLRNVYARSYTMYADLSGVKRQGCEAGVSLSSVAGVENSLIRLHGVVLN